MKQPSEWNRLENASLLFPHTSSKQDTKVFRFSCELKEEVDPKVLASALNGTLDQFPLFRAVLRGGLFWHYLEGSELNPVVREEYKPPASPLYHRDHKTLLFEVTYFKRRINLEVFHVLADGTGALYFFRTLVVKYLTEKHQHELAEPYPTLEYDASLTQRTSDGFRKYYERSKVPKKLRPNKAYQIRGLRIRSDDLGVIEGRFSASQLAAKVRECGATMSEYLTAVLIYSIHEGMRLRDEQRPVVISVPVNLRNFFPEESARNFFGVIAVAHHFRQHGRSFEEILAKVQASFKELLTEENVKRRMNSLMALQESSPARFVPLVLKDPVLKVAGMLADKEVTAGISNLGRIEMPEALRPYIHTFGVFNSTRKVQICLLSFGDMLSLTITSHFISTDIQRCFFRKLTDLGLDIDIISNLTEIGEGGEPHEV